MCRLTSDRLRASSPPNLAVLALALLLVLGQVSAPLEAQPASSRLGPLRSEIVIDNANDEAPRVALDQAGNSVHVWARNDEVYFRIFDVEDNALLEATQLNTITDGDQLHPEVAVQPDGSFFAIWRSREDGEYQLRARYFDAVTGLQASDQQVNDLGEAGSAGHSGIGVAALDGGGFVVVWESFLGHGADTDNGSASIQGKLVSSSGVVSASNQFQVNDYGTSWQLSPDVAPLSDGGFFVVWESRLAPGDSSGYSVRGRRFTAAGAAASEELQLNTTTPRDQQNPHVARNSDGELLVVFESDEQAETTVRGRWFSPSAVPLGNDFAITTRTDVVQYRPRVAGGPHFFVVVWQRVDGDNDLVGRLVTGIGEFDSSPFQLNSYDPDSQRFPAVAANHDQAWVTWKGINNLGANTNAVIGRGFQLCLFCDEFESGDTSLWSGVKR